MAAVTNNTQPQTLITRNQTLLFAKDGSLFEALASIYSIDIPTLSKDETTGQTKGTGKVTGLFNRMLTIPFTNTSNLVSDMMNDVTSVDANANVIYNVSIVRNADRTISPVFERANLNDLISLQGWATSKWCTSTFATKGHNHTEYAKSCDFSGGKFILKNVNDEELSSATLTGLATENHTHNEYIKSAEIDSNGVLNFNYEQSENVKTVDLKEYYSPSVHTHSDYVTHVYISGGVISLYNGSTEKSSVDLRSYYSSTGHTHSYVTGVKLTPGSSSKKITVTVGDTDSVIDLSHFKTDGDLNDATFSAVTAVVNKYSPIGHKHTAIYTTSAVDGTSVFYFKSPSFALISVCDIYKSSDIRLKDHITSISASEKLEHFVKFNWKETGKESYGVIAQEVEKNHPELVTTQDNGFKAVSYDALLCYQLGVLIEKLKNKGII